MRVCAARSIGRAQVRWRAILVLVLLGCAMATPDELLREPLAHSLPLICIRAVWQTKTLHRTLLQLWCVPRSVLRHQALLHQYAYK